MCSIWRQERGDEEILLVTGRSISSATASPFVPLDPLRTDNTTSLWNEVTVEDEEDAWSDVSI